MFIRVRWGVHSRLLVSKWYALGAVGVGGFIGVRAGGRRFHSGLWVRPGGRQVHPRSLGFALEVIGFIR